jgi:hypothetical protein
LTRNATVLSQLGPALVATCDQSMANSLMAPRHPTEQGYAKLPSRYSHCAGVSGSASLAGRLQVSLYFGNSVVVLIP